jgi:hypothetical protein
LARFLKTFDKPSQVTRSSLPALKAEEYSKGEISGKVYGGSGMMEVSEWRGKWGKESQSFW